MGVTAMVADEANHLDQVNVGEEKPVKQFSDRELNQTTIISLQGNPSEKALKQENDLILQENFKTRELLDQANMKFRDCENSIHK
jgi:hypothetical protein